MSIGITPTNEHPLPDSIADEFAATFQENARVAANTATLMSELGMPFEMTAEDEKLAQEMFKSVDTKKPAKANPPELYTGNVALKLSALLTEYDHRVVMDAVQARTYITNRLLELSSCGDPKHELRAIELLGKLSDINAFNEKSEITITHCTSDDLKNAIQEKIERLLHASTIDITPSSVEEELGLDDSERMLTLEKELDESPAASVTAEGSANPS